MSQSGPDTKDTKPTIYESEIIKGLLKNLEKTVNDGFVNVNQKIQDLDTKYEAKFQEIDNRQTNSSIRAKSLSQTDETAAAELAKEKAAREELAKKVDSSLSILQSLEGIGKGFLNSKLGKGIALLLYALALSYLQKKGITIPLPGVQ